MEFKRIGVASAAKIVGALYLALGLLMGLILGCFALLGVVAESGSEIAGLSGAFAGGLFVCFFPLLYGVLGAAAGAIGAAIYNVIAGQFGGLEIEVA